MSKSSPISRGTKGSRRHLQKLYDRLWSGAIDSIRAGKIEIDSVLASRLPDQRRGLTVIAQPSRAVRERVSLFLDELRTIEPDQHYYFPSEFHVTVLSLFTATIKHELFLANTTRYLSAVDSVLHTATSLYLEFHGITVSAGTVMIQGFLEIDALNRMRDKLRSQLRDHGLSEGLDQRYRLETAHMTVARFCAPLSASERFVEALKQARHRSFGPTKIVNVSLVKNDWYMTHSSRETLRRYSLR